MAAIITVTVQLYLQIYWVSAKTGFDKRRRWSQSFPLPNFSASVLVVEAGDFRHIFPDYSKYTALYGTVEPQRCCFVWENCMGELYGGIVWENLYG